jgi:hypothetical protein
VTLLSVGSSRQTRAGLLLKIGLSIADQSCEREGKMKGDPNRKERKKGMSRKVLSLYIDNAISSAPRLC